MHVWPCFAAPEEGAEIAHEFDAALHLGVSMPLAAARLGAAFARAESLPDLVLLFGVAGAYPERHLLRAQLALHPGDVAWIDGDRFSDLGVHTETQFLDLEALGLVVPVAFDMDPALTAKLAGATGCPRRQAATVATGAGNEALSQTLASRSGAQLETMEGAAVAATCAEFGVRMVQVRAISNYTGDRARGAWDLDTACVAVQGCVRQAMYALAGTQGGTTP